MRDLNLNLIRSTCNELLLHIESYYNQLQAVPNEKRRKLLLNCVRYMAQRLRDLVLLIENEEPE